MKNDTLDMILNDIVQMLSLNDLSSHLESWFQELRSKSRPDSVFAKMPASVKHYVCFDDASICQFFPQELLMWVPWGENVHSSATHTAGGL